MPDAFQHAVNLDRAVRERGVAQAPVTQEDYEGSKTLMQDVWKGNRWEKLTQVVVSRGQELVPARVLLGFLRGYFLYREVPENDQAFWPHFLEELGIKDRNLPTPKEYDRLWEALAWHEETRRELRHRGHERDFIGTLDAIFHFRALRLPVLKKAFGEFYRKGVVCESARAYEGIFSRLKGALDILLDEQEIPDLTDEEEVLRFLEGAGLHLGRPNPIRLLFRRSPEALADLYRELKGLPRKRERAYRHPQVRVEVLESPESLAWVKPALSQEPLVEGWKVYGQVILDDGRFRPFSWVPRLGPNGEPLAEEVTVVFPEGEVVRFRLHHRACGIRFGVPRWRLGTPLPKHTFLFQPKCTSLRYFLAPFGRPAESEEALTLEGYEGDIREVELVVEIKVGKDEWRRIASLPVELDTGFDSWVEGEAVWVRPHTPGLPVTVRLWVGERLRKEWQVFPRPEGEPVAEAWLLPQVVEVEGIGTHARHLLPPKGWPKGWYRLGIAL